MVDHIDVEEVAVRSGTTAAWAAAGAPVLARGELGIDLDAGEVRIGDGASAFADLSVTAGGAAISHYEATWVFVDFADAPAVIYAGAGPHLTVELGVLDDNGAPGYQGTRQLTLPVGTYYLSWGGFITTPAAPPAPGDPLRFGEWSISWDDSAANLSQGSACLARAVNLELNPADQGSSGALRRATTAMIAVVTDPTDRLSIGLTAPYGGISAHLIAYLAITKIG
jgi:hypothetical protein